MFSFWEVKQTYKNTILPSGRDRIGNPGDFKLNFLE